MDEYKSQVSKDLQSLRKKAKLNKTNLAELLGMPYTTYDHYEKRFKKEFLPIELVKKLKPIFMSRKIDGS